MSHKPWRNGLIVEEFPDGSAQTCRLGKPTMEQRGTASRPSHEDVKNHTADEWAEMKLRAKEEDEAAEKAKAEAEKPPASPAEVSAPTVPTPGPIAPALLKPSKPNFPKKGRKAK